MFRDSSHCSTSPPSHRRISTITSTQDFPQKEPPLRIWVIQTLKYTTPLSKQPLYKRQGTTTITSHQRDKTLSQTTITSTLRGIRHKAKLYHSHLYTRGISIKPKQTTPLKHHHLYTRGKAQSQIKGGITILVIRKITNNFSSQKQDPIDRIEMITQV